MRTSRIISGALAVVMAASTPAIGGVAASAATVKKPTKVKAVNTKNSVKITWKKVKGAKKYKVYRGKKVLKTVKSAKYYDKKAKAGKTYKYSVKAVKGKTVSKASKKVKATRLTQPKVTVKRTFSSLKVTWGKVKGATKYEVYRKLDDGKYSKAATVKTTSYNDTKVKDETNYTYKVKAVKGKSKSVYSAPKTELYIDGIDGINVLLPKGTDTATLSWTAVPEATAYEVYDEEGKLLDTIKATSFKVALTQKNISILKYSVVPVKGATKGNRTDTVFPYIPVGSYFTDKDGNVHAKVELKVGDVYKDGAVAADLLTQTSPDNSSTFEVKAVEATDVAELTKTYEIKALKAGTAQFEVKYNENTASLVRGFLVFNEEMTSIEDNGYRFGNQLKTGVAYVDVTVTE
ncbi:MAG: hypothetical protein IIU14_06430 [Ruminococcus sp.]|nr:hypothetical protein [Ruminococcus sp.]